MPAGARISGQFGLRLDDGPQPGISLLRDADGGSIFADVIHHTDASEHFARKQLGATHIEDFVVEVATLTSSGLFEWVAASWTASPPTRDGAVLACKSDYTIMREQAFDGAVIAQTVVPTLDAGTKGATALTVRFVPETTSVVSNPGGKLAVPLGKSVMKLWVASNFRLEIAGLDCTKVGRIDGFTVERDVALVTGGGGGFSVGPIDFPDLRIVLSQASAPSWVAWHKDFVIDGHNADDDEKTGSIRLLGPDLKTDLARIDLHGLGIHRLEPEETASQGNQIPRMVADLYCEQMTLVPGGPP